MRQWAAQLSQDYLPKGWEPVSSSPSTRVAVNKTIGIYFKEYLTRSPSATLKAQVRGSRATRARLNADALLLAGIDAPHNVFWGQLPRGSEYLFTVEAPGESVHHWLRNTLAETRTDHLQLRRQLLFALGTFIGRVHATGFIHGELKPDNVLAVHLQDQFRFTLLNNVRTTRKIPTPGKRLLRDLMMLNMVPLEELGRTDRMRFYCGWRRQMRNLTPVEKKILAVEAYRRGMRRLPAKTAVKR